MVRHSSESDIRVGLRVMLVAALWSEFMCKKTLKQVQYHRGMFYSISISCSNAGSFFISASVP